jgi:hypothetical protein
MQLLRLIGGCDGDCGSLERVRFLFDVALGVRRLGINSEDVHVGPGLSLAFHRC